VWGSAGRCSSPSRMRVCSTRRIKLDVFISWLAFAPFVKATLGAFTSARMDRT
jgi:hypothetical protein